MILLASILVSRFVGDLGLPLASILRNEFLSVNHLNIERIEETFPYPQNCQFYCWSLTNDSKEFLLKINLCVSNSKPGSFALKKFSSTGGMPHFDRPFSKFPFGLGYDSEEFEHSGTFEVVGDHERILATFQPHPHQDINGFSDAIDIDNTKYLSTIERTLRNVYSGTVVARTSLISPIQIGAVRVQARMDSFGSAQFIELSKWAVARSWNVGSLASDSTVTLSKGDHTIILYLGGHQCKVDGKEQGMGEPMINVDGTAIFVPYSLDAIAQKL